MLENKNVLMILAHPDDEILFGWPIFQNTKINKFYLCCSTDENNTQRAWCSHRKNILNEVCKNNNVSLWTIPAPSEFYKLNSRRKTGEPKDDLGDATSDLRVFKSIVVENAKNIIKNFKIDYIFTHNPFGEYGHLDHIFLFDTVVKNIDMPVLITDITLRTNWCNPAINNKTKKIYFNNKVVENCNLNMDLYLKVKAMYEKSNVWTWSRENQEEFKKCNLYLL